MDYFTTALQPDEILVDVRIPKHTDWAALQKFSRIAQAWSIVAVAARRSTSIGGPSGIGANSR